jgi:hypothetical protein
MIVLLYVKCITIIDTIILTNYTNDAYYYDTVEDGATSVDAADLDGDGFMDVLSTAYKVFTNIPIKSIPIPFIY